MRKLFYRILLYKITYNVKGFPSGNIIPIDILIFALNCFGTQQRSGSFDEDFITGTLKIAGTIVRTTNNL